MREVLVVVVGRQRRIGLCAKFGQTGCGCGCWWEVKTDKKKASARCCRFEAPNDEKKRVYSSRRLTIVVALVPLLSLHGVMV